MMIRKRTLQLAGGDTSLALEQPFWEIIDNYAMNKGLNWTDVVRAMLEEGYTQGNRASFIRTKILDDLSRTNSRNFVSLPHAATWSISHKRSETIELSTRKPLLLVGRSRQCDLRVEDPLVSRKHLLLAHDGECWWGIDLNSQNGTRIGKKSVKKFKLDSESEIAIGDTKISLIE